MKKVKIMKMVFSVLAIVILPPGCRNTGNDALSRAAQEQEVCRQTAKNFQPGSVNKSLVQNNRPYNGLDLGAWALAQLPDGSLVVGGEFTAAGRIKALHVARWDPAVKAWSALGDGLPEPVIELVSTPLGRIYASTFQRIDSGTETRTNIYRWNNKTWEFISGPLIGGAVSFGSIEAMLWDGKEGFFLGGRFSAVGGLAVNGIIHWDGNAWSSLQGSFPLPGLFATLALAKGPGGWLYAGGILKTDASDGTNRVFAWNRETWTVLGGPLPRQVESLAVSSAGHLTGVIVRSDIPQASNQPWGWSSLGFNASTGQWTPIDAGLPALSEGFKVISDFENVGFIPVMSSLPANEIADWEGSLWQARSNPYALKYDQKHPARVYVLAGVVYVLGAFGQMGGVPADNIAAWDGLAWKSLSGGPDLPPLGIAGKVNAIVVDRHGVVTVGGDFKVAGDVEANNIARWDGKAWQPLGSGTDREVTVLAVGHDDQIYAGGNFNHAGGKEVFGPAEWNPISAEWEPLSTREGPFYTNVAALAVAPDGVLYAATFVSQKYKIYALNGKQWEDLPGLIYDQISVLHVDSQGRVLAGGSLRSKSGTATNGLSRWDAESRSWVDLGADLGLAFPFPSINQLIDAPDGSLFVGGNFTSLGGKPFCYVARLELNGAALQWTQLGGGLPSFSRFALGQDGRLYAVTSMPRGNGESDYQLVYLAPGGENWQLLGGVIGRRNSFTGIGALSAGPNGLLFLGGEFSEVDGAPARSFSVYQLSGN